MRQEEQKLTRIMELIKQRDQCIFEIIDILEDRWKPEGVKITKTKVEAIEAVAPSQPVAKIEEPKPSPKDPKVEHDGKKAGIDLKKLNLIKFTGECNKCAQLARGIRIKGRHKKGCKGETEPEGKTVQEDAQDEPQLEITNLAEQKKDPPGFQADWRSICCNSRVVVRGGSIEDRSYECLHCYDPCEVHNPTVEKDKPFTCDDCSAEFTADPGDTVTCPECSGANVWPKQ